jgi:hypothetical protein
MIRVKRGDNNDVIMRLWDSATIENPHFIFSFINNEGNNVVFKNEDNSTYPPYYNSFTFSVANGASASEGGFTASVGTYFIKIWESEFNDLNIASASYIKSDILMIWDDNEYFDAPSLTQSGTPIFITK